MGGTAPSRDAAHFLGPYLREIPRLPVGQNKGNNGFVAIFTDGFGWIYDNTTGQVTANCKPAETDSAGNPFVQY